MVAAPSTRERTPGSDNFDLVVRDKAGKREIVDVATLRAAHGGTPYAINYFLASPDGSKVAVGISQGGSEAASIFVYDTATGKQMAGSLDRADFGATSWSNDSKILYFVRLKKLAPGEADTEKYRDATLVSWDLKSEPVALLGSTVGHGPSFLPDETPTLGIWPGAPMAMAVSFNGVQNEQALWLAPVSQVNDPTVKWTPLVTRADEVTAEDAAGDTIYLLSHKNAPTFQVLSVKAGQALAAARVLVPAQKDRVIDSIRAAADALYVLARQGAYSLLVRVPYGAEKIEEVTLPFKGHVEEAFTDPRKPGITIDLESFVVPPTTIAYDPVKRNFTDLKLGVLPHYDSGRYEVSDLEARAEDGVMVPTRWCARKARRVRRSFLSRHTAPTASRSSPASAPPCAAAANWVTRGAWPVKTRTRCTPVATLSPARKISSRAATRRETSSLSSAALPAASPCAGHLPSGRTCSRACLHSFPAPMRCAGNSSQRSGQHSRVRHRQDKGGFQEPLRDGHDPACAPGRSISTGDDHDRPERSARLAVGAGEAHRCIASIANDPPHPAAHRCGSGARHRIHQVAK